MSQQHSAESISSLETSHYQALNVAPDATLDEIRRSYQSLALRFHPDKSNRDQPKTEGVDNAKDNDYETDTSNRFIRIDEAWKVLRDEETRRIYDAELMQRACREEYFVNEVLRRADFRHEEEEDYYYHTCRCGGLYMLPEGLGSVESCYIGCDECSLVVQVDAK